MSWHNVTKAQVTATLRRGSVLAQKGAVPYIGRHCQPSAGIASSAVTVTETTEAFRTFLVHTRMVRQPRNVVGKFYTWLNLIQEIDH